MSLDLQAFKFRIGWLEVMSLLMFSPEQIHHYKVRSYSYLDDLSFIQPLDTFAKMQGIKSDTLKEAASELFKRNGWEGDGDIGVIWLPPFAVGAELEDTSGIYVLHVKQSNNGTSWLASEHTLPFDNLNR